MKNLKNFWNKYKKYFYGSGALIVLGIIFGLVIAVSVSGCAREPMIITKKVNIATKVKLDPLTYNQVMQPPKITFVPVDQIGPDGLLEYTIDLQNKYLLLRNTFYNTIEKDKGRVNGTK